jgi:hypothetical protein
MTIDADLASLALRACVCQGIVATSVYHVENDERG